MKKRSLVTAVFVFMASVSLSHGALQFESLYSRAVKTGESVATRVDSLNLDMRVNSGVAVSKYTFVVTPGSVSNYREIPVSFTDTIIVDGLMIQERVEPPLPVKILDSIEISLSFTLPTDFVADSMWLWIDGKPVKAAIQDRALASAQYQEIVGKRRDPALLETWGNGSYNLRIFPTSSFTSRKISIEFHHLFDDDELYAGKGLAAAAVPIRYNGSAVYDPMTGVSVPSSIGNVGATFAADDHQTYTVEFPGVGEGTFSTSKSLMLSANNVVKIDTGIITMADPSGTDELLWTAMDPQSELFTAGATINFTEDNMRFENESDTRILLIDMRNILWNWGNYYQLQAAGYGNSSAVTPQPDADIWVRAQKCAVLALQQYLKEGNKFNVLIGGKTVTAAFTEPAAATEDNIQKAITAIINTVPSGESSTKDLLKAAMTQAPKAITILISDLFTPAQYQLLNGNISEISSEGKRYDAQIEEIRKLVTSSELTLFTINDNWEISQIALMTGGYNLAGILQANTIAYTYEVIDGIRVQLPSLPALFGNNNGSGLRHFSVVSDQLEDIAYTIDNTYSSMLYAKNIMIEPMVLAKSKIVVSPDYYSTALRTGRMHIAGRTTIENSGKPVNVTIKGKLDGLWFTRTFTASGNYLPTYSSYRPLYDPQWAFRTTEKLAFDDYIGNASRIKAIGKEYHIVTRQTSLLALEPGMELWEDTAWQTQSVKSAVPMAGTREFAVVDQAMLTTTNGLSYSNSGSGFNLDGISLQNLLLKNNMPVETQMQKRAALLSVRSAGNVIYVTLPSVNMASPVMLKLFDLKGRVVATHQLSPQDFHGTTAMWDLAHHSGRLSRGIYSVQITNGAIKKVFRSTLIGK